MIARFQKYSPAFSLIELLVVIGIIAIVLGILLPVLAKTRRSAYSVRCASNLRQIGMACSQYLADSHGLVPNNSYTLGDDPSTINPLPASGTVAANLAETRGYGSTCNLQWFDAIAAINGWHGNRTVASRGAAGQADAFRRSTQYLWCPCIDQSKQDPDIFATNYGISFIISQNFQVPMQPRPPGTDGDSFDFIKYARIKRTADVVFLAEGGFYNYNGEAYHMQNASLGNLRQVGTNQLRPQITHTGLNYLFFDGHVSNELRPPQALGVDVGTFVTNDGAHYQIAPQDIFLTHRLLGLN